MSLDVIYTDVNALTGLKKQAREDQHKALPEVARQFESVFIGMMLKSARKASLGDDLINSSAIETSRDLYDQQMSIELAKGAGMGIAQSIIRQFEQDRQITMEPDIYPDGSLSLPVRRRFDLQNQHSEELMAAKEISDEEYVTIDLTTTVSQNASATRGTAEETTTEQVHFQSATDFVEKLWPLAEKSARELGVKPEVLISQAALETGWGRAMIRQGDKASNNLFNIKANAAWQGEKIAKVSLEYEGQTAVERKSYFRVYNNLQESFDDYVRFIKNNRRYRQALEKSKDSEQYLHEIHQSGYATDPDYVKKIMKVMNSDAIRRKLGTLT